MSQNPASDDAPPVGRKPRDPAGPTQKSINEKRSRHRKREEYNKYHRDRRARLKAERENPN